MFLCSQAFQFRTMLRGFYVRIAARSLKIVRCRLEPSCAPFLRGLRPFRDFGSLPRPPRDAGLRPGAKAKAAVTATTPRAVSGKLPPMKDLSAPQIIALLQVEDSKFNASDLAAAMFHISKRKPVIDFRSLPVILIERLLLQADQLRPRDLSSIILACRRTACNDKSFWAVMLRQASKKAGAFDAQGIANTLNA